MGSWGRSWLVSWRDGELELDGGMGELAAGRMEAGWWSYSVGRRH